MKKRGAGVVEQLRDAIKECGLTLTELSGRAGIALPLLTRFVKGQRGLTLATVEKLCAALGLELTKVALPGPKKAAARPKKAGEQG